MIKSRKPLNNAASTILFVKKYTPHVGVFAHGKRRFIKLLKSSAFWSVEIAKQKEGLLLQTLTVS